MKKLNARFYKSRQRAAASLRDINSARLCFRIFRLDKNFIVARNRNFSERFHHRKTDNAVDLIINLRKMQRFVVENQKNDVVNRRIAEPHCGRDGELRFYFLSVEEPTETSDSIIFKLSFAAVEAEIVEIFAPVSKTKSIFER